jgi:hypothetical protein
MKKQNEKTIRLRYIRVLEKFNSKAIGLLKKEEFDLELYKKAVLKGYEELKKSPTSELYSEYPIAVKNLAQTILDTTQHHSNDFEEEKAKILKLSNLLDKLKNNNRYKKEKHRKKKFVDEY